MGGVLSHLRVHLQHKPPSTDLFQVRRKDCAKRKSCTLFSVMVHLILSTKIPAPHNSPKEVAMTEHPKYGCIHRFHSSVCSSYLSSDDSVYEV